MTIVLRLLHIIGGLLWVGGLGFVMFLIPAVRKTGPAGGQFMQHLVSKTTFPIYMPIVGLVTTLAGFALYWRDMTVSNGSFGASRMGMTYGIGGAAALVALIVGGVMTGGSAGKLAKISQAAAAAGGPPSAEQMQRIGAMQARMNLGARISGTAPRSRPRTSPRSAFA